MKTKQITIFVAGFILGILFLAGAFAIWQSTPNWRDEKVKEVSLDDAYNKINGGEVQELTQHPTHFNLTDKKGNKFFAKISAENDTFKNIILTKAIEKGASVKTEEGDKGLLWTFLFGWLPILFFAVFFISIFILLLQLIIKNARAIK